MTDIVVTIARANFHGFLRALGPAPERGVLYTFDLFGDLPPSSAGDALYVVSHGRLRVKFMIERLFSHGGHWKIVAALVRPVTLEGYVPGFRDWRRKWWRDCDELPFAAWRCEAVPPADDADIILYAQAKWAAEQGGAGA